MLKSGVLSHTKYFFHNFMHCGDSRSENILPQFRCFLTFLPVNHLACTLATLLLYLSLFIRLDAFFPMCTLRRLFWPYFAKYSTCKHCLEIWLSLMVKLDYCCTKTP